MYAQNGHFLMLDGFGNAVGGSLGDSKTGARPSDPLMMGAVDQAGRAVQAVEDASGIIEGCMDLILFAPLVQSAGRKVLDQRASKIEIQKLHALADTKNRTTALNKEVKESKLRPIQLRVDMFRALIFLMEEGRINVSPSRQQETAAGRGRFRGETGEERRPQFPESSFIIRSFGWNTGNQNSHRIRRIKVDLDNRIFKIYSMVSKGGSYAD